MRSRRHKGKREPLFWSRACATSFSSTPGDSAILDCESSTVQGGIVLFDPVAAQINSTEARVTVRKIFAAFDVALEQNNVTSADPLALWEVTFVTPEDPSTLVTTMTLEQLVGSGLHDIVNIRMHSLRDGTPGDIPNSNTVSGFVGGLYYPLEINVQRKLDQDQKVVMVWGWLDHHGRAITSNDTLFASYSGIVSVLWQRTLR